MLTLDHKETDYDNSEHLRDDTEHTPCVIPVKLQDVMVVERNHADFDRIRSPG